MNEIDEKPQKQIHKQMEKQMHMQMQMQRQMELLKQMELDLSVHVPYVKGQPNPVINCWHFYTDGNAVDRLFDDREDFKDGMNRIFTVGRKYRLFILAFSLMDTHVHFVIYGDFDECNRFMHEYVRLTSIQLANRHNEKGKLKNNCISHQKITDDYYLKSVICYVIKNPPAGGLPYTAYDYPWGSGGLYFRNQGLWNTPFWKEYLENDTRLLKYLNQLNIREKRSFFKSRQNDHTENAIIIEDIIFPGEYVAYEMVEKLFKTHKSFNYFMCRTKDEDIEKIDGIITKVTIPIQELRQHRKEICQEIFGQKSMKELDVAERLKIGRIIKFRFKCSVKQICRVCGLIYEDVKDIL